MLRAATNSFPLQNGDVTCVRLLGNRPLVVWGWVGGVVRGLRYKENEMYCTEGGYGKEQGEAAKRIYCGTAVVFRLTAQIQSLPE